MYFFCRSKHFPATTVFFPSFLLNMINCLSIINIMNQKFEIFISDLFIKNTVRSYFCRINITDKTVYLKIKINLEIYCLLLKLI